MTFLELYQLLLIIIMKAYYKSSNHDFNLLRNDTL